MLYNKFNLEQADAQRNCASWSVEIRKFVLVSHRNLHMKFRDKLIKYSDHLIITNSLNEL